ncbi:MAG: cobalamin-dependent protein [SAR324 cluster bacterium]|jgi:5-methyltetrahydrofolate--homocysteine methyltransferase|nr:cobalamin-binding protein [Deltaproteobacteria bacterium]MDP6246752.1 cobalamin-dependent protein [SAR324 cluster bacterium]|tara:strand:+ start:372 stop:1004 length:633 start_codon:yes stop_codon:yes gene_type:complete
MDLLDEIYDAIIDGKQDIVVSKIKEALKDHIQPEIIMNEGLILGLDEVGRLYEEGTFFVPDMLIAARTMQAALKLLRPLLVKEGMKPIGKVAIGTVQGDLHDIGKSIVAMMFESNGFEIMDLGVDVQPEKFISAINDGAQIIAVSALLTTTMTNIKTTIESIEKAELRDQVIIMVGGAPVTEEFANAVGADGFAINAPSAVRKARELLCA